MASPIQNSSFEVKNSSIDSFKTGSKTKFNNIDTSKIANDVFDSYEDIDYNLPSDIIDEIGVVESSGPSPEQILLEESFEEFVNFNRKMMLTYFFSAFDLSTEQKVDTNLLLQMFHSGGVTLTKSETDSLLTGNGLTDISKAVYTFARAGGKVFAANQITDNNPILYAAFLFIDEVYGGISDAVNNGDVKQTWIYVLSRLVDNSDENFMHFAGYYVTFSLTGDTTASVVGDAAMSSIYEESWNISDYFGRKIANHFGVPFTPVRYMEYNPDDVHAKISAGEKWYNIVFANLPHNLIKDWYSDYEFYKERAHMT